MDRELRRAHVDRGRRPRHGPRRAPRSPGRGRALRSLSLCRRRGAARAARRARRRARRRHRSAQLRRDRPLLRVPGRARARDPEPWLRRCDRGRRQGLRRGVEHLPIARSRIWPSCSAATSAPTSGAMRQPRTASRPRTSSTSRAASCSCSAPRARASARSSASAAMPACASRCTARSARSTSRWPRRCCSTRRTASAAARSLTRAVYGRQPSGEHCSCAPSNAPQRTCVLLRTCYVRPHRGLRLRLRSERPSTGLRLR